MKCNASACEEVRRFFFQYIESVKSPEEHVFRLNYEMGEAFRAHFRDRFARCPDHPVQEFRCDLADLAETVSCEGLITECEIRDALKQVSLNKLPGRAGLPYQEYLRLPYMFVLFWRICSTIGSPRESSLLALRRAWSHCWRKVAWMFGRA